MKRMSLCVVAALAILSCKDDPIAPTLHIFKGRIAFGAVTTEGSGFIYSDVMMVEGGGNPRKITSAASCYSRRPNVTKDGSKIAFSSCAPRPNNIFIAKTDGTELRNITNNLTDEEFPLWSPDGRFLSFISFRDGWRDIFVLNDSTGEVIRVTQSDASYWSGRWSAENSTLVYYRAESVFAHEGDIYSFDLQSRTSRKLTDGAGLKMHPALSPNGNLVAYQRDRKLHFLSASGDIQVTGTPDTVWEPMYRSSDGAFLIFSGMTNGRRDIYKINRDGSGVANLTLDFFEGYSPVLSPDDAEIAYVARTGSVDKIFLMSIDGKNKRPLTNLNQREFSPSWGH